MNNYKERYKICRQSITEDSNKKWVPVIERTIGFSNLCINTELSIFLESYQLMESSIPKYVRDPLVSRYELINGRRKIMEEFPDDYIELSEILMLFRKDFDNFLINDTNTKLNIVGEYYNVVTMRKGLLLENDIRIEGGKFLDSYHQEKVDKEIRKIIDLRIEFILCPDKRDFLLREDKIKRILRK